MGFPDSKTKTWFKTLEPKLSNMKSMLNKLNQGEKITISKEQYKAITWDKIHDRSGIIDRCFKNQQTAEMRRKEWGHYELKVKGQEALNILSWHRIEYAIEKLSEQVKINPIQLKLW